MVISESQLLSSILRNVATMINSTLNYTALLFKIQQLISLEYRIKSKILPHQEAPHDPGLSPYPHISRPSCLPPPLTYPMTLSNVKSFFLPLGLHTGFSLFPTPTKPFPLTILFFLKRSPPDLKSKIGAPVLCYPILFTLAPLQLLILYSSVVI